MASRPKPQQKQPKGQELRAESQREQKRKAGLSPPLPAMSSPNPFVVAAHTVSLSGGWWPHTGGWVSGFQLTMILRFHGDSVVAPRKAPLLSVAT